MQFWSHQIQVYGYSWCKTLTQAILFPLRLMFDLLAPPFNFYPFNIHIYVDKIYKLGLNTQKVHLDLVKMAVI